MTLEDFGREIAIARKKKGYTQEEMARLVDMKQSNYSRIENGSYNTGIRIILKLADVLDMKLTFTDK